MAGLIQHLTAAELLLPINRCPKILLLQLLLVSVFDDWVARAVFNH